MPPTSLPPHLALIAKCRDDAVLFAKQILNTSLEPWQEAVLKDAGEHDRIAIKSAPGAGKTRLMVILALWFLMTRIPVKVMVTSPAANQIENAFWAELQSVIFQMPATLREQLIITGEKVSLTEGHGESFIVARTANKDKPENLMGLHSRHVMVLVDEAGALEEVLWKALRQAMTTKGAKMVIASNPIRLSGFFFDCFHKNSHLWRRHTVTAFDSQYSREGTLIDEIREEFGENSADWRIRVLGEFPIEEESQLIPRELVEAAVERNIETTDGPVIWGLDPAHLGGDRSALVKRKGNTLLEPPKWWIRKDTMQLAGLMLEEYNKTPENLRPDEIYVDAINIGAGIAERMRETIGPKIVRSVNVSENPANKDRYNKLRDELWDRLREWFYTRTCVLPRTRGNRDMELLVAEISAPKYEPNSAGKLVVESKKQLRSRLGRSPDLAEALMLTMMNDAKSNYMRKNAARKQTHDLSWVL